jgi:hypothetical protein
LNALLQFGDYLSKEHVDHKCVDGAFVVHIEHTPEVVEGLRTFFVFHSEHEVKESFVIHFALEGLEFFKNSVNKNLSQTRGVAS